MVVRMVKLIYGGQRRRLESKFSEVVMEAASLLSHKSEHWDCVTSPFGIGESSHRAYLKGGCVGGRICKGVSTPILIKHLHIAFRSIL